MSGRGRPSRNSAERALPHNLEAEKALLGAILVHNEAFGHAAKLIDSHDFFRDAHRRIFDKMVQLSERNEAIDLVTLKEELARAVELEAVGGPVYIAALADGVPRSTNVEHYARIVKQHADARTMLAYARHAIDTFTADPAALGNGAGSRFAEAVRRVVDDAHGGGDGLPADALTDAVDVVSEGRQIEAAGIPQLVDGMVPALGMLGFGVAYAKTGKTTFFQAMGAAVAMGRPFLDRPTIPARVLNVAAEDPKEYVAWTARHLDVTRDRMTFFRRSIVLDARGLAQISATALAGGYGLVLISSWQSVIRGLVKDENDNAGAVQVVEAVKAATRETGVPWVIDAHSGKGEDQGDDADPSRAMRGASAAAGAADYTLLLRYANGAFGTQRRLSGKGRFVSFSPITMDFDPQTSTYTVVASTKDAATETTWRQITEMGALATEPRSASQIAEIAGITAASGKVTNTQRRQVQAALRGRPDVAIEQAMRYGTKATLYKLLSGGQG